MKVFIEVRGLPDYPSTTTHRLVSAVKKNLKQAARAVLRLTSDEDAVCTFPPDISLNCGPNKEIAIFVDGPFLGPGYNDEQMAELAETLGNVVKWHVATSNVTCIIRNPSPASWSWTSE